MYEKKVFLDIGGFDEKYFCYHEDVDLAFRIRLAGGKCIQKSDAVVYHVSGGISGKASDFAVYHGTRNRIWTFVKCMPVSGLLLFGVAHILLNFAFIFWSIFRKNRIKPTLRGVYDGVRGLPLIWKERKNIQRNVNLMALLKILTINPIKPLMRGDGSVKIQFN
jgi:GT2 family glycosyltransferase